MKTLLILILSCWLIGSDYNATEICHHFNIAYQDYNYLMALSGILIGFTLLFGLSLLALRK